MASGKLRLPDFQRPQRWEYEDRKQLLDSIYRGYPVGTLLLWSRPADAGTVRWGDYRVDAGQQPAVLQPVDQASAAVHRGGTGRRSDEESLDESHCR